MAHRRAVHKWLLIWAVTWDSVNGNGSALGCVRSSLGRKSKHVINVGFFPALCTETPWSYPHWSRNSFIVLSPQCWGDVLVIKWHAMSRLKSCLCCRNNSRHLTALCLSVKNGEAFPQWQSDQNARLRPESCSMNYFVGPTDVIIDVDLLNAVWGRNALIGDLRCSNTLKRPCSSYLYASVLSA